MRNPFGNLDRRSRLAVLAGALAGAAAMALALFLATSLLLPLWIKHTLESCAQGVLGGKGASYESTRIGLFGSELKNLSVAKEGAPPLRFASCSLEYTPLEFLRGRLSKVVFSGLDAELAIAGGTATLNGRDLSSCAFLRPGKKAPGAEALLSALDELPLSIGSLEIRDAHLKISNGDFHLNVPFVLTLSASGLKGWDRGSLLLKAFPNGQQVSLRLDAAKKSPFADARLSTPRPIRLEAFPFAGKASSAFALAGELGLEARASFASDSFQLLSLDASAKASQLFIRKGSFIAEGPSNGPLLISARQKGTEGSLEITGLRLARPLALDSGTIRCAFAWDAASSSLAALSTLELRGGSEAPALEESAKILLETRLFFKKPFGAEAAGFLRLAEETPKLKLRLPGQLRLSAVPALSFQGSLSPAGTAFSAQLELPQAEASSPDFFAKAGGMALNAARAPNGACSLDASLKDCELVSGQLSARLQDCAFKADAPSPSSASGYALCGKLSASDQSRRISFDGASLKLPFAFPFPERGTAPQGEISVERILFRDRCLGSLSSSASLCAEGLALSGAFNASFGENLALRFESLSSLSAWPLRSKTEFSLAPRKLESPFDLGLLHPKAKGWLAKGEIALAGDFSLEGRRPSGYLALSLKDGSLRDAGGIVSVEGIEASFKLPQLPEIRSEASQRISFASARLGSVQLSEGLLEARIDAANRLFVESFKASCCGGKLRAQAFAFDPDSQNRSFVLHCDRISIARFLSQIGFGRAEGEGSLNGSVPVSLKDGELSFQDAFLYSTPGEPGLIRLDDNGLLAAGLPERPGQPDVAGVVRESLKSYAYAWAKIALDSKGETLDLKLHLDGRPSEPLPFRIENGLYVRDDSHRLIFQGVRMDLNFHLPLSEAIGLGGDLKKALNQGDQIK